MVIDLTQLDDFVYLLQCKEQDYLLFATPSTGTKEVPIHLVQCYLGEGGLFEFGEETFQTQVWVAGPSLLDDILYSMVTHIVLDRLDLENPTDLYHLMGGFLRVSPEPREIPTSLLN